MTIKFSDVSFLEGDFDNEVAECEKYAERKTGFENIDDAQIFMPALYTLGGSTGAGKTTFALQLLYQLAEQGEQCFYFSFEQSEFVLWAKVLARELFIRRLKNDLENAPKATSAANLMRGRGVGNREIYDLKRELASSRLPLKIAYVPRPGVKDFMKELPKEEGAVISIDYLQLLAHDKDSPRGAIDDTIYSFREYQYKTKSTLIILNSVNREAYKTQATLASFKESGGIEYTSDVAWVLQAYGVGDDGKFDYELASEESRKVERRVRLSCLKNRFGRQYLCDFFYHAAHDCFRAQIESFEEREEENPSDKPKTKRRKYVK